MEKPEVTLHRLEIKTVVEEEPNMIWGILPNPKEVLNVVRGAFSSPSSVVRNLLPFDIIIIDTNKSETLRQVQPKEKKEK